VRALLEGGADPNGKSQSGNIPVVSAFFSPPILQLLLDSKADPNLASQDGETPLMKAARPNQPLAAQALLSAGADSGKRGKDGQTAREIAQTLGHTEVVSVLESSTSAQAPPGCTIADAAKKQVEIHGLLQARVKAGRMNSSIFRTFAKDTEDFGRLLTEDVPGACRLLESLRVKYGL
jgi:hypothetical protein